MWMQGVDSVDKVLLGAAAVFVTTAVYAVYHWHARLSDPRVTPAVEQQLQERISAVEASVEQLQREQRNRFAEFDRKLECLILEGEHALNHMLDHQREVTSAVLASVRRFDSERVSQCHEAVAATRRHSEDAAMSTLEHFTKQLAKLREELRLAAAADAAKNLRDVYAAVLQAVIAPLYSEETAARSAVVHDETQLRFCLLSHFLVSSHNAVLASFVSSAHVGAEELSCRAAIEREQQSGRLLLLAAQRRGPPLRVAMLMMRGVSAASAERVTKIVSAHYKRDVHREFVITPITLSQPMGIFDTLYVTVQRPSGGRWNPERTDEKPPRVPAGLASAFVVQLADDGGRFDSIDVGTLGYAGRFDIANSDNTLGRPVTASAASPLAPEVQPSLESAPSQSQSQSYRRNRSRQ